MLRRSGEKGTTTLEVMAALILFALAAAGLAVALPFAFERAAVWSDQQTLAWFLERNLEEWRSLDYENIPFGTGTFTTETVNGKTLQCDYATTIAAETAGNGSTGWSWSTVNAPEDAPIHGLTAVYYDNINFSGTTVTRIDPQINFDWGSGSPDAAIGANTFSVKWTGFVEAQYSEKYTFYTTSDERVRLTLNKTVVIENMADHTATEDSGSVTLKAGKKYRLTLEMCENTGAAVMKLSWQSPSTSKQIIPVACLYNNLPQKVVLTVTNPATGLTENGKMLLFPTYLPEPLDNTSFDDDDFYGLAGLYFNSIDFSSVDASHQPINTVCRIDPGINFNWGTGSPMDGIGPDHFSVRWTGYLTPQVDASYYFYTTGSDGVRLWADNSDRPLIDTWSSGGGTAKSPDSGCYLRVNQMHPITMDFSNDTGNATAILKWSTTNSYADAVIVPKECFYPSFSPIEDAYVGKAHPTVNYGSSVNLVLAKNPEQSVYLKFKLAGLAGKTVRSVRLHLYSQLNSELHFKVKKIAVDNWNEKNVTYDTAVTESSTTYATYKATPGVGFFDIDLDTSFLNDGDGIYGIKLEPLGGCSGIIYSRETEAANLKDYSPRLTVIYDLTPAQYDNLVLYYWPRKTGDSINELCPWFKLVNNGTVPVDLTSLKIRYWYTRETSVSQNAVCDHAGSTPGLTTGVSYSDITSKIIATCSPVSSSVSTANCYLEIGFSEERYLPAGVSVEIQMRVYNSDWSNYTQSNDYSYNSALTDYGLNPKVTLYVNDALAYGTPP
jgi:type II secretory pathway pseudopilin PulG